MAVIPSKNKIMRYDDLNHFKGIRSKGWREQERQYLFHSVFGNKALTKNAKGLYKTLTSQNKRYKFTALY
jgi:hypothetical protein